MTVSDAVSEYMYSLGGMSKSTKRLSRHSLAEFSTWCKANSLQLERLKATDLRRYAEHLRTRPTRTGKPLSSQSLHNHFSRIKAFLSWASREEDYGVKEGLIRRIPMPTIEKKVLEVFTAEQFKALYDACAKEPYEKLVHRDRAILMLLGDTGIRVSELCSLELSDVFFDEEESFIRILHGKGRKQREVGFGAKTRKVLKTYINRWRRAPKNERHVFISHVGGPIKPSGINMMLDRLEAWSGVSGVRVSAHTFRHFFAVNYLKAGGDLYKLSRLLGHGHVGITERYLQAFRQRDARQGGISVVDNL